ncbi:hypothetical protein [Maridesulfovibrio sp.]|uniref:hypothetical protein n=1 Tax=Maridesulfovibrio sp. TaxID=2795000 RepID=UPI002AA62386|nr:hypothetical protein [Maridesulfovibrio sp.]
MNKNWKIWAAMMVFTSSYFPLSLVLLIQDINSQAVRSITIDKIQELLPALFKSPIGTIKQMLVGLTNLLHNPEISLPISLICFVSIFILRAAMKSLSGGQNIKVIKSLKNPSDLMNYTVPYMVAFIGVDLGDGPKVAGFLCFMIFMFILTYKSKQLFMNPILAVLGYSLYDVDYEINSCIRSARILAKDDLIPDTRYRLLKIASLPIITIRIPQKED